MRIRKLAPSVRVGGRWLCHLEDGTILRLGESEVVAFGLGTGKELDEAELSALTEAARAAQVREKAVELLSARPLSRKELVEKLTARPRNREKEPLGGLSAASGRSSTAGGCRGTAGTALWRGCPARRRPSTPFCRRSCGGRSSPTPRCAGGQPTLWPAGATAGRTSVPACAAMVRSRRNGRKNAADRRM